MKPTHLLGIDFGASSLRIHCTSLAADDLSYQPSQGADFDEAQDGVMPQLLELDASRRRIACYGRTAEYKLREEGGSSRFLSNLKSAVNGEAGDSRSREEAFRWSEEILKAVASSLTRRINSPLTLEYGWAIYAAVPDRWTGETYALFKQMLQRCFMDAQVELVPESAAALYYYINRNASHAISAGSQILVINCGDSGTDFVLGTLGQDGDPLHDTRSYRDEFTNRRFDERIARFIAASGNIALPDVLPADLLQNSKRFKEQFSEDMIKGYDRSEMPGPLLINGKLHPCPQIVLTRSQFESDDVAGRPIREFGRALGRALNEFGIPPAEIQAVIPIGGGANWYFLPELLKRRFPGYRAQGALEPHLAVVQGLMLTPTMQSVSPHPVKTPLLSGFRIRIQGKIYSLPIDTRLTRMEIPSLEPGGADTTVAAITPHRADPAVLGLKNLSQSAWTLILPDGKEVSVAPGRIVKLTSGSKIDFNGIQGEVRG